MTLCCSNTTMSAPNSTTDGATMETNTCTNKWWVFITTSTIIYALGLSLSLVVFLCSWLAKRRRKKLVLATHSRTFFTWVRRLSRQFISGDTIPSRILIFASLFCSLAFIGVAVYRTTLPITQCFDSAPAYIIVEAILSILLFFFFVIRFFASENIVLFWFHLYTIVDVLTLFHVFVSLGLGQDWLGLRSLRFIWLIQITNILGFTPFIRSQDYLDIITLLIRFVSLWLTAAGVVHLLEASGDPWDSFQNAQDVTFQEYVYFIMVTMSTVGYGDYFPKTVTGKIFVTFFILGGLAFFAITLPALVEITVNFYRRTQYSKFDTRRVPQHVIVCGHITVSSAKEFLDDFLHEDHGDKHTHVLFLHPEHPEQGLRTLLRSYYTRVQYIVGSVLSGHDLLRAKIHRAKACFIIADKHCSNPIEEDNGNLLRLVSVKNTTAKIPVIVQVLRAMSKEQISHIPGWNRSRDIAICLNELKLGLLAQSCMCPGLSTLVANLFYTSGDSKVTQTWQELYLQGASNELYPSRFSSSFYNMSFHQAAEECYEHLGLILVAVQKDTTGHLYISPSPQAHPNLLISSDMQGYFIGPDSKSVNLVSRYCSKCHMSGIGRRYTIKRCTCDGLFGLTETFNDAGILSPRHNSIVNCTLSALFASTPLKTSSKPRCSPQTMESCILGPKTVLNNHIVMCLFANEDSPIVGLWNFLEPLRSNVIPNSQIKPVVIVTNRAFLEKEWELINQFPDVHLVFGSPLHWATLVKAHIETCSVCVILTGTAGSTGTEQAIDDKEAVLCSLCIQSNIAGKVMVITDLIQESNVQFLDISDEDELDERIYKAQPFACGEAFATSMFDSVTTAAFHSPGTLYLVENIIGCFAGTLTSQSNIVSVPLSSPEYSRFIDGKFSELYIHLLKSHSICLAIYRQLEEGSSKHYVITAPSAETVLQSTDTVFVLNEWVTPGGAPLAEHEE